MMILKMRVPELRNRCSELGLDTKGLKAELIDRINEHLERLLVERFKKLDKKIITKRTKKKRRKKKRMMNKKRTMKKMRLIMKR